MTIAIVTNQAEFDNALASRIEIRDATEPITVRGTRRVEAYDKSRVCARDGARVLAYDDAYVRALDSATVVAHDSATVVAHDSATVVAYGWAMVAASHHATVRAGSQVAVRRFSIHATVTGGVIIDHTTPVMRHGLGEWLDFHAVERDHERDAVILFKAVTSRLTAGERYDAVILYEIGTDVTAPDWRADSNCGGGLHLSPTVAMARNYGAGRSTRYLKVRTPAAGVRPLGVDKCKVRTLTVLAEVDLDGFEI
jgi:2-keto-4-pentenoate hydratase/2-oxohepta-3-ene-1,7-dioic acid hydratase in catechol pathway